uniref:Alpha-2-macroglobulin family protein n=1 Tax=Prevotella sp. GTC17260 TaxID=3236796 RepID=A0AB33JA20_9BACT
MKKYLLALVALITLCPFAGMAESYVSLWKRVAVAEQKDLPKTQIAILNAIVNKATAAGDYGQLIKAQLKMAEAETAISPDSLGKHIERLEKKQKKAEGRQQVLADVYAAVLGHIYKDYTSKEDHARISKQYYELSVRHPDLLARQLAKDYEPLVVKGYDSSIFYEDLLHVVGLEAEAYKLLHDYYKAHGNRAATCICAYLITQQDRREDVMMVRKSHYLQTLDSLIGEYGDLPMAGEVAIERYNFMDKAVDTSVEEKINYINYALSRWGTWPRMNVLRNAKTTLTLPCFLIDMGRGVQIPGKERQVAIRSITNVQQLKMTVTRLDYTASTDLDPNDAEDYAELRKHLQLETQKTVAHRYIGLPAYKVTSDSMVIEGLAKGVYLVEFTTDNSNITAERALLHVSDVYAVSEVLPKRQIRIAVVSATTGQPIPGAKVRLFTGSYYGEKAVVNTVTCDDRGEHLFSYSKRMPDRIYAFTAEDKYCPDADLNGYFGYNGRRDTSEVAQLLTDRKVYRPGQTVHVAAIVYKNMAQADTKAVQGKELTLTLHDANGKKVASKEVKTDGFGTASAEFTLPTSGLTGRFLVRANVGYASTDFSVEEYKRPTFEVLFDKVKQIYHSGDTVRVQGKAHTYAGMPVQGAQVAYSVVRRSAFWWYRSAGSTLTVKTDTTVTADDGTFKIDVPMLLPEEGDVNAPRYYSYEIEAKVTDLNGESHTGETRLPLSNRTAVFTTDLPAKIESDSLKAVSFSYLNISGEPVAGKVYFKIDDMPMSGQTNTPISDVRMMKLKSGLHVLKAICNEDTLDQKFVVFSVKDRKTAVPTHDWFYQSAETFPRDGKPVYVQIGSSDADQHILYTMMSGDKVLESGVIRQSEALNTRAFRYQKEWGDGILLTYAWVKDGQCYTHVAEILRPLPDKRLLLEWKTFRNRLVPGQDEEWTLTVKRPDGKAADAQLVATLYDKSLDQIRKNKWNFVPSLHLSLPKTYWQAVNFEEITMYGELPMQALPEKNLGFSHFDESLFDLDYGLRLSTPYYAFAAAKPRSFMTGSVSTKEKKMMKAEVLVANMADAVVGENELKGQEEDKTATATGQLRENLNETAFFYPALMADKNGDVNVKFTLPESVTTWKFMGLAHDADMRYGMLEGEAVAQKTVMIQPNMPRFMRLGDKGEINARLSNTSDKSVKGKAMLQIIDPETEKVLAEVVRNFNVEAGKSANVNFTVVPREFMEGHGLASSLLICRTMVEGRGFSDGEQHYLLVLPEQEMVTNTLAFSQQGAGVKMVDLAKLAPVGKEVKLTIEYTNNPEWLMIQSLPTVSNTRDNDAISLAAAYYANSLAAHIVYSDSTIGHVVKQWKAENNAQQTSKLMQNEELKSLMLDETPWLTDAKNETEQQQLLADYLDESQLDKRQAAVLKKLSGLQNPDGSWSWWPGMQGSRYVTAEVTKMLARLCTVALDQEAFRLITKSISYLDKQLQEEYEHMMAERKRGVTIETPSEMALETLYIKSLLKNLGRQGGEAQAYMLKLIAASPAHYTIYGKANTAVILARNGYKKQAENHLNSLNEYSVYKEEMGRYYDARKAFYSWCDYKIPTEVAAIEAMYLLRPTDKQTITDMQRWLLQCKRTQSWDTPINAVNAIYAFTLGSGSEKGASAFRLNAVPATLSIDGNAIETKESTAIGYVKTVKEGKAMKTFTAEKKSEGTSWGALYVQFAQHTADIKAASMGIQVKREIVAGQSTPLKVGDKIKVRITITADRDYDFVQIQDKRAACLEPVSQLSGYHWGYYCTPRDNTTNYYFDQMAKGTHVVETEYYVDRAGEYQTGLCTVQCAYAPEYSGRAAVKAIHIK